MRVMLANLSKMVGDAGGLAKVTSSFANEMIARGHSIGIVHSDEEKNDFFYTTDCQVQLYNVRNINGHILKYPAFYKIEREFARLFSKKKAREVNETFEKKYLVNNLKNIIKNFEPDVIVSFQLSTSKLLLFDLNVKIPIITMIHGHPGDIFFDYPDLDVKALAKSDICQVLLPSFKSVIIEKIPQANIVVIGNVVPQNIESSNLEKEKKVYKIIQVGRLGKNVKRQHLLIEAFAKVSAKHPNWIIEFWGAEGKRAYTNFLNVLIKKYGLEKKVFFRGTTSNVFSVLSEGDIFAFPSAFEGFGLALAEAMSVGLPVIGYRSCSAVNELILDGENGFLCADGISDLADKLDMLMSDKNLRIRFGKNGKISMQQYEPKLIWDKWESLLKDVSEK
jgi:glycosyltransferase involved in cell wall biosynthesis